MVIDIQWGEKLETFISEYDAPTHIRSDNVQLKKNESLL